MLFEYFSDEEIMKAIKNEIGDEVAKSEFNAIEFMMPDNKKIYSVGLFIDYHYILDCDIFEASRISEVKTKIKEISRVIKKNYKIESTYNINCSDGNLKIENQKIS